MVVFKLFKQLRPPVYLFCVCKPSGVVSVPMRLPSGVLAIESEHDHTRGISKQSQRDAASARIAISLEPRRVQVRCHVLRWQIVGAEPLANEVTVYLIEMQRPPRLIKSKQSIRPRRSSECGVCNDYCFFALRPVLLTFFSGSPDSDSLDVSSCEAWPTGKDDDCSTSPPWFPCERHRRAQLETDPIDLQPQLELQLEDGRGQLPSLAS
jgi:hypothetical protein